MTTFKNILAATAASVAALAIASSASAQEYNGTSATGTASTTTTGTVVSTIDAPVGCNSTATCLSTIQSVATQNVGVTTTPTTTGVSTTINGITYNGFKTVSGAGGQTQTVTTSVTTHLDPVTLLPVSSDPAVVGAPVLVGSPSVTALSATGAVGSTPRYSSTLATSGLNTSTGVATATENESLLNSAGVTFSQRVGTASFNSGTGAVTVTLPAGPTSSTSISATGITTTGSITAASASFTSLNMNGGKISNLGAGTLATDAVNKGQLDAFQTTINGQLSAFQTTINGQVSALTTLVHKFNKRLEGGIAVATALSGGAFLPDKKINITGNIGSYRGEVAGALQIGALISENVALNAGVATGFSSGAGTAFRGGFTFGF